MKTYTHTEEGKDVLNLLSNIISTHGMEVYKCRHCDELYASPPEEVKDGFCGICESEFRQELKDSHGLEGIMEDDCEEEEEEDGIYMPTADDVLEWQYGNDYHYYKKLRDGDED